MANLRILGTNYTNPGGQVAARPSSDTVVIDNISSLNTMFISSGITPTAPEQDGLDIQIAASEGGEDYGITGAGAGGGINVTSGNGGLGASVPGSGGLINIVAGQGGNVTNAVVAGTGGNISITAGGGGNDNSIAPGGTPGAGGAIEIVAGTGGTADDSATVANGGNITLRGGTGGGALSVNDFGGDGGSVTISGGEPGSGVSGQGAGGSVLVTGYSPTTEGDGGSVSIVGGNAGFPNTLSSGLAGAITISGGNGGLASVAGAGTNGGSVTVTAGDGGNGTGSGPPGFGGSVLILGGNAGTVLSAGAPDGGNVSIQGGTGAGFSGFGGTVQIDSGNSTGAFGNVELGVIGTTANIINLAQDDITFQANGGLTPIPFNDTVDVDLVGFTSTSVIGALNELMASPGGVTDHGALTGLADDDHAQYLLVSGTRAMTGRLVLSNGTAATPGVSFTTETNTGFYRSAANTIDIALAGVSRASFSSALVTFNGAVRSATNSSFQGTAGGSGNPTFGFTSDPDSGLYSFSSNIVGIACGSNASYRFADGTLTFRTGQILTTAIGNLTLEAAGITIDGLASDVVFSANSMVSPIFLNEPGDTDLDGSFTATSIVGALNELKTGSTDRFTVNAGSTITDRQLVIVNGSGTVDPADADNGDQFVAGIALNAAGVGVPVVTQVSGPVTGMSGLTPGARYYASTTPGAITSTSPVGSGDLVIEVGFAISATVLLLRIQEGYVIP